MLSQIPPILAPALQPPASGGNRWEGSAYAFARSGDGRKLAAGGTLGGSQIGARFTYRLNDAADKPVALSGRLYAPASDFDGSEVALGIDWKPLASLPVRLLAERRQALGGGGRSAWSLLAHGGVSEVRVGEPLRLDAYAQVGIVGAQSRDLFADGAARIVAPIGDRVRVGAGAWAAAQPRLQRVDLGPTASVRIGERLRLAADWRVRVAGDAPASGPALTLSTDF